MYKEIRGKVVVKPFWGKEEEIPFEVFPEGEKNSVSVPLKGGYLFGANACGVISFSYSSNGIFYSGSKKDSHYNTYQLTEENPSVDEVFRHFAPRIKFEAYVVENE